MAELPIEPNSDRLRLDFESTARTPRMDRKEPADIRLSDPSLPTITTPAGYGYGAGYGNSFEEIHLLDYLRILHKRRWVALSSFVLVVGTVAVMTLTATPLYSARVQILIENENPNVVKSEEVYDQNKTTNDYYQTQYKILQSRALAKRTMDAERLWDHPLFAGTAQSPNVSLNPLGWLSSFAQYVAAMFSDAARPRDESAKPTEDAAQSRAIDAFLRGLVVSPVRNSRLVDVSYTTSDAPLSARVANALAKQYIDQNLEFKYLATKEATDFLSARASEQRKALEKSEQALQQYREKTGAMALEDRQNIVVQRLADLNAAVTRARTERIEKESVYNQALQNDRKILETFPAILNNSFIQQMKVQLSDLQRQKAQMSEKLGARHPDMLKVDSAIESTQARVDTEIGKVVQALKNDYQAALTNERSLQTSLDQQRAEAQELNRAAIQYGVLQRDATSNQTMFSGLLERSRETGISGELRTSNIRIVDPAETPRRATSPNKLNNMSMAFFGGSFLGIALAFFFEYLDNRIKQPEEIKAQLGLPFLGMVPAFTAKEITGPPLIGNGVPSEFSEAFRGIRTGILFSSADSGSKTIVVTSTGPGEGKSVVSANIALSLALAGQRVLLIDADMRRPKTHEFFGVPLEPGLSNVLVGDAKASETVKKTLTPNLWLLAAGKHPPNPAELIGSRRFNDFLGSLSEHFEWVIIDSPPVMAVTDASVIAHRAHGVVFVVGAEMTSKGAAKAALEQLDAVKAKYVGGILNRVDVRRNPYYYARYSKKEYQSYYAPKVKA